ncbi:MAG: hypothetical protein Q8M29_20055 [Bacteroidota bacterium]|nr:hypothetical protein [Bacteroidota bacterium]
MRTTSIKTSIKKKLDDVENEMVLRSIDAMLEEILNSEDNNSLMTKEQKHELDKTLADHKAGKLKYYTVEQARKIVSKK